VVEKVVILVIQESQEVQVEVLEEMVTQEIQQLFRVEQLYNQLNQVTLALTDLVLQADNHLDTVGEHRQVEVAQVQ
jgi:hypothetical protein